MRTLLGIAGLLTLLLASGALFRSLHANQMQTIVIDESISEMPPWLNPDADDCSR